MADQVQLEDVLDEMDDDALAEAADGWKKEGQRLQRGAAVVLQTLVTRMRRRRAKVLETAHWSGKMKPGPISYTVDDPRLLQDLLVQHLAPDDVAKGVEFVTPAPFWKVNQAGLNDLAKRGGRVLEIVEDQRKSVRGDDVLDLKRKADVEVEPPE